MKNKRRLIIPLISIILLVVFIISESISLIVTPTKLEASELSIKGGETGLTGEQIAANIKDYIGMEVDWHTDVEATQNIKWKILYADNIGLYLIASNYVDIPTQTPKQNRYFDAYPSTGPFSLQTKTANTYGYWTEDILNQQSSWKQLGTSTIYGGQVFRPAVNYTFNGGTNGYGPSGYEDRDWAAVNYMSNQNIWKPLYTSAGIYGDSDVMYVWGGPSIELMNLACKAEDPTLSTIYNTDTRGYSIPYSNYTLGKTTKAKVLATPKATSFSCDFATWFMTPNSVASQRQNNVNIAPDTADIGNKLYIGNSYNANSATNDGNSWANVLDAGSTGFFVGFQPVVVLKNTTVVSEDTTIYANKVEIEKEDADTHQLLPGADIAICDVQGTVIKVNGADVKLTTDSTGKVDFAGSYNIPEGIYYYKEVNPPTGYTLNQTIYSFTVDAEGNTTFNNTTATKGLISNTQIQEQPAQASSAQITKYKSGTTTPVSGAVIGLCDVSGNVISGKTITTNANGKVDFASVENLVAGTYYYKEVTAPTGYKLNETVYSFTVDTEGNVTYNNGTNGILYNEEETTTPTPTPDPVYAKSVIVTKYKTGTTMPIAGAEIALCDVNGNIYRITDTNQEVKLTTDSTGKINFASIADIEPGTYYYKEVTPPSGYKLNTSLYSFTVDEEGNVTYNNETNGILYNEELPAEEPTPETVKATSAVITKYKKGTTTPLAGAVIALCNANGNIAKISGTNQEVKLTTDNTGKIDFASIINLVPGTYYYKEVTAPTGYQLNETVYSFTVSETGTVTYNNETNGILYNEETPAPTPETVKAVSAVITKYKKGTTTPLQGAVIGLCDASGNVISGKTITTDNTGKIDFAKIEDLIPGTYYYKEVTAPTGYKLDSTVYSFTVSKTGTVTYNNGTSGIIYNDVVEVKPIEQKEEPKKELPYTGIDSKEIKQILIVGAVIMLIGNIYIFSKRK